MGQRALVSVVAMVVAISALLGAPVAAPGPATSALAAGSFTDAKFRESSVFTGLSSPVSVRFASDGRAFVAEKAGVIKTYDSITDATADTVLDIRSEVNSYWDRGLLGLAVDPQFPAQPYLYIFYAYDAPPGGTAPVWNDTCPSPPGGTADGCVVTSRLERLTLDAAFHVTARKLLIEDWCQQFPSHSGGGLAIGADGQLYLSGGDGASFNGVDYGQRGGTLPTPATAVTKVNPCGDPVTVTSAPGATPTVDAQTAEGGMLRSQDVRTTADPVGLDGAIIRVDPATGAASAGNPLAASADPNARRILAHGLRNPYRLAFRPGTGEVWVGEVGNGVWEEINRLLPAGGPRTPSTMPNFGWPCYEGPDKQGSFAAAGNQLCDGLYAGGSAAITQPLFAYNHVGTAAPCGVSGASSASPTGLAFYQKSAADQIPYPDKYDGALFFVDYSRKCLVALLAGGSGIPDPATMEVVATGLGSPVDLVTGPHGDLYYPDLDGGRVVRIRYVAQPVAVGTATPSTFRAPGSVALDASASRDPDPEATLVAWKWDLDHDGAFDGAADRSGATVNWPVTVPAVYPITLQVTSSNGLSDTAELVVDAANDPPVPVITSTEGNGWSVGDTIHFSGSATDAQDGVLGASALTWDLIMHHCRDADCHTHTVETFAGVASGSFVAPDHEYPSHLELRLTATDSKGVTGQTSVRLDPQTTTVSLNSVPAVLPLLIDGVAKGSPSTTTLIRGGGTTISAALAQTVSGSRYRFSTWNDSRQRARDLIVKDPVSLTATYVPDAGDTCATAKAVATGTWTSDLPSGGGDEDWFRFTLGSKLRTIVTLGNLPVNARLELYRTCGSTRLAVSDRAGETFEEITQVLAAGTYRVRVSMPSDDWSGSAYRIRARTITTRFAVKSAAVKLSSGVVRVAGEVLNNTGATTGRIAVTATFKSGTGKTVGRLTGSTFAYRLGDGGVSPFLMTGAMPAFSSVSYAFSPVSPTTKRTLTLTSLVGTANANGTVTERGTVKNAGTTSASLVGAARTWYGRLGEVLDFRTTTVSPSTLAKGRSGSFAVTRPVLSNVQATRTHLRGR